MAGFLRIDYSGLVSAEGLLRVVSADGLWWLISLEELWRLGVFR